MSELLDRAAARPSTVGDRVQSGPYPDDLLEADGAAAVESRQRYEAPVQESHNGHSVGTDGATVRRDRRALPTQLGCPRRVTETTSGPRRVLRGHTGREDCCRGGWQTGLHALTSRHVLTAALRPAPAGTTSTPSR